ncbi:unnamed protein product [Gongylonema pulchrum]|uniref:Exocyst complex component Sec10 n=1 Tax=Gongylonema pulchrum TaxID=637853 RepID=A0A183DXQ2_9BILA|nr:unnamed protein product [Gongylonema pulchrum]
MPAQNINMFCPRASDLTGLNCFLVGRWDRLVECVLTVFEKIGEVAKTSLLDASQRPNLQEIINCHFYNYEIQKTSPCSLCVLNKHITQLEALLFIRGPKAKHITAAELEDKGTGGGQKISLLESILRIFLATVMRTEKELNNELIELGRQSLEHFEDCKTVLAAAKRFHTAATDYAAIVYVIFLFFDHLTNVWWLQG